MQVLQLPTSREMGIIEFQISPACPAYRRQAQAGIADCGINNYLDSAFHILHSTFVKGGNHEDQKIFGP